MSFTRQRFPFMALTTKDKVGDEWFCNIPPFLGMVVDAMRPV
jgi:hypothetical protein